MIDSNIVVGVWLGNAAAKEKLSHAMRSFTLIVSPIVLTELFAHPGTEEEPVMTFLVEANIALASISNEVFLLAGRRFAVFAERRRKVLGEGPRRVAADFIIGAHAATVASALITLDTGFYARNFPELKLA